MRENRIASNSSPPLAMLNITTTARVPMSAPPNWRSAAMRRRRRRPAPASTCKAIMRIAPRCSWAQSGKSPWRAARCSHEIRLAVPVIGSGSQADEGFHAALQDDGIRPAAGVGHSVAHAVRHGDGVFGIDFLAGLAQVCCLQELAFSRAAGDVHRRLDAGWIADVPRARPDLAKVGAVSVCHYAVLADDGVSSGNRQGSQWRQALAPVQNI